jgi:phage/plasmid-associated DNA primase
VTGAIRDPSINWHQLNKETIARDVYRRYFQDRIVFTELGYYIYTGVYWKLQITYTEILKSFYDLYAHYSSALRYLEYNNPDGIDLDKVSMDTTFKQQVIVQMQTLCFVSETVITWNADPYVIAFNNHIGDLRTGKFITATANQYINKTCGYDYLLEELTANPACINYVEAFLRSIWVYDSVANPDTATCDFMKCVLSSFLLSGNKEEVAYFFIGTGRNGKGALTELLASGLGTYILVVYYVYLH